MKKHRRVLALLLAVLLLAGCGQGGGGAESPSPSAEEQSPAVTAGPRRPLRNRRHSGRSPTWRAGASPCR